MILVDVYIPSVDKTYNFNLSQNVNISLVIDEISEMIRQKEHCNLIGDVEELILFSRDHQCILDKNKTLEGSGVITGHQLLLV